MVLELQSEDNEKKAEVVGKADNNKKEVTKEQRENKNMILNKDENIETNKSEGEVKGNNMENQISNVKNIKKYLPWKLKLKTRKTKIPAKQIN